MRSLLFVCLICASSSLWANKKGIGATIGNPTGINGKYWLNQQAAIDGGLGMSVLNNTNVTIFSDYLYHSFAVLYVNDVHALDLYYGIGGRMEFADEIELGVRLPIGLSHMLDDQLTDIFTEVAPVIDLVGKAGVELHLLIGGRYYF
jgi:hypothetical protein